jgi:hypothetical protein
MDALTAEPPRGERTSLDGSHRPLVAHQSRCSRSNLEMDLLVMVCVQAEALSLMLLQGGLSC